VAPDRHGLHPGADRVADDRGDALLLLRRDPGPERQGEVLRSGALGLGEVALRPAEVAQRRLEVERREVVEVRADAVLAQRRRDPVTIRRAADEQVVDVAGLVLRRLDEVASRRARFQPSSSGRKIRSIAAWTSSRREL
jgi:hypothetical protein